MNTFIFIFVFCLVLFLYLHIFYHLKISNDLEIYSVVNPTKHNLEEICDIRQPVMFVMETHLLENININYLQKQYGAFDINVMSYEREADNTNSYEEPIHFIFNEALEVLKVNTDANKGVISMRNKQFLEETTLIKQFKQNDYFLRPPMVSVCDYDVIIGSKHSTTKVVHELNYRNYVMCLDGKVTIRVISPTYKKYVNGQTNYADFEFYSPLNIWNIQDKYKNAFDKVKTMDIVLHKGDVVYLPAYWYYSIQFNELSLLASFKYRTYMNTLAILPELGMYFLQNQNIKRQTVKTYNDEDTNMTTNERITNNVHIEHNMKNADVNVDVNADVNDKVNAIENIPIPLPVPNLTNKIEGQTIV